MSKRIGPTFNSLILFDVKQNVSVISLVQRFKVIGGFGLTNVGYLIWGEG